MTVWIYCYQIVLQLIWDDLIYNIKFSLIVRGIVYSLRNPPIFINLIINAASSQNFNSIKIIFWEESVNSIKRVLIVFSFFSLFFFGLNLNCILNINIERNSWTCICHNFSFHYYLPWHESDYCVIVDALN